MGVDNDRDYVGGGGPDLGVREGEVLIVGAGPAGVSTALFLAKKGIRCTVIEKETFPRDKICGDGLTGWVVTMLYKLDMGLVEELRGCEHSLGWSGVKIMAPNYSTLELKNFYKKRPDEPIGYTIRRKELDQILINKVKSFKEIELVEGVAVTGADFDDDGVTLQTNRDGLEFRGKVVVWADGAKSPFSRKEGKMPMQHKNWLTAIKTYYSGLYPEYSEKTPEDHRNNALELYVLNGILPGYLWIFPLANGEANVGLGMRTDILKKKRVNLNKAFEEIIESTPVLKERFSKAQRIAPIEAWPIPIGVKKRPVSGDRYLIVGDAASLADPGTGEGVGNSLNSGFHAAEHLAECLSAQRFDRKFNLKYDKRLYDKLWKELRLSKIGHWVIVRPRIMSWATNKALNNPQLRLSLVGMLNDEKEIKKLRRPWFYLKLIFGRDK